MNGCRHLARFVVEVIDGLDLWAMSRSYRARDRLRAIPRCCSAFWFTAIRRVVFSSRKLERATYDSVAFRFIAANDHPDHDTIATFSRRSRGCSCRCWSWRGRWDAQDGHRCARRHEDPRQCQPAQRVVVWVAGKIAAQLKAEVAELLARAEAADQSLCICS
jgi:hypothetical protein